MTEQGERERRWRAGPAEDCAWAEFDAVHVLYHRPSGKTHFLNAPSARLLLEVLKEPVGVEAAARQLAALGGANADAHFVTAVAQSIKQLEWLGLVEPA